MSLIERLKKQKAEREAAMLGKEAPLPAAEKSAAEAESLPAPAPKLTLPKGTGGIKRRTLGQKVTPMPELSAADFGAAQEPQQKPKASGLSVIKRRQMPKAEVEDAEIVPEPAATSALKLPGALGRLKANADARVAGAVARKAPSAVRPAAQTLVEGTYDPEQMLRDLQAIDMELPEEIAEEAVDEAALDAHNAAMDEINKQRAAILAKGGKAIEDIFQGQMHELAFEAASDQTMAKISQIVKITFMRVQSAPNAWAFMELADRAKIIQGMKAMAIKRNSVTKKKKPKEAAEFSEAVDAMSTLPESDKLDALVEGFDIAGF